MSISNLIRNASVGDLQFALDNSSTIKQVLAKLGVENHTSYRKILKEKIISDKLSTTKFEENYLKWRKCNNLSFIGFKDSKIPIQDILVENSNYNRHHLKKRLVDEGLLEYRCDGCGNDGQWNGNKLSLQLDHRNGIPNDNRIENLRFLCPNCHSQTDTYAGKNRSVPEIFYCSDCNGVTKGFGKICSKCLGLKQRRFEIDKDELEKLVSEKNFVEIGKLFGVSDNAIRKRCKRLGINT